MKLYVCGPVTGIENDNRDAFEQARTALEELGHDVEIPHDTIPAGTEWAAAMKISIKRMVCADGVCFIDGWASSRGANIEFQIADTMRFYGLATVKPLKDWLRGEN